MQIQVVNQATQFIQRAFDWRADDGSQKIDEAQFRRAKCSLYLYYRYLHDIACHIGVLHVAIQWCVAWDTSKVLCDCVHVRSRRAVLL